MRSIVILLCFMCSTWVCGQKRCVESGEINSRVDLMPVSEFSMEELTFRLNSEFKPNILGIGEGETLILTCIVNCMGESFGFESFGVSDAYLQQRLKDLFSDVRWSPGKTAGVEVDCKVACDFRVIGEKFVYVPSRPEGPGRQRRGP